MATRVIHLRDAPPGWMRDERFVYIGRPNPKYDIEGRWGNPIYLPPSADDTERDRILDECAAILDDRLSNMYFRESLRTLSGKILVCFCHPKCCHGDHMAHRADQLQAEFEMVLSTSSERLGNLAKQKSLEDQIQYARMETNRTIAQKLKEAEIGLERIFRNRETTGNGPTGMPAWFKRWRQEYLTPVFDMEKKADPESYRIVNDKLRYNYRDIPQFYAEREDK